MPTFEEAAAKVLAIYSGAWREGSKTRRQWLASMRDHVFPHIGDKSIDEVTTADIMTTLLPIWTSKYVTARKVRQRIGTVMKVGHRPGPTGAAATWILGGLPRRGARGQVVPIRRWQFGGVRARTGGVEGSGGYSAGGSGVGRTTRSMMSSL